MSRHGKRSPLQTAITISIPKKLKAELRAIAERERRTLSNFCALELERIATEAQEPDLPVKSDAAQSPQVVPIKRRKAE